MEFPVSLPFELFLVLLGVGGTIIGTIIAQRLKHRAEARKEKRDEIEDMRKAIWRLQKTIIILAKILDEQVAKAHPELQTELEGIVKELLDGDID